MGDRRAERSNERVRVDCGEIIGTGDGVATSLTEPLPLLLFWCAFVCFFFFFPGAKKGGGRDDYGQKHRVRKKQGSFRG